MPSTRLIFRTITAFFAFIVIPLTAIHYYREFQNAAEEQTPPMMSALKPQPQQIIIVGAGLAGLSAAHAALTASSTASVLLLERGAKPGGNSIKASSGINGAPTRFQAASSVQDTLGHFVDDTARSAGTRLSASSAKDRAARDALISTLAGKSAPAVHFLHDTIGVDLSVVAQLGGHSVARTHRGAGKTPPGFAIISALLAKLKDDVGKDRFELRTGCEVTRLLTAPPAAGAGSAAGKQAVVVGVEYSTTEPEKAQKEAHGSVIFTTGGFAGDAAGLLAKHRPDLGSLPSTNDARPGSHDILERDVGASLLDMDSVQVHPTGFVDPSAPDAPVKILAAEMLRGEGGILLREGKRFVNEMEQRDHISGVIMKEPPSLSDGPKQWDNIQLLLDPGACEAAASHIGFYVFKGLVAKKKVSELDETTRQTLREYSAVVRGETPDPFGRKAFGHWRLFKGGEAEDDEAEEVCVGRVTPITHFTMGGAAVNEQAQILAGGLAEGTPIEGLWAAGEITGGIHGDNRLGGSSLLECVVFGRIAGEAAAKYVQEKSS